jgi:hypothetical protein
LDKHLPRLTLEGWNASVLDSFGTCPEAVKELFYVDLGHNDLLVF